MAVSKAQARAIKKYDNKAYFKSLVRFKKEDEERIRAAAGDSLNGFIVAAVMEKVQEAEKAKALTRTSSDECPF
jgi:hypothetical protein